MSELLFRPAIELAQMVREGEVTSLELVEASLERIDALNPELNAFVHLDPEGARETASAIEPGDERPFAGVPIAIKDNVAVAGMPLTFASDLYGDFTPAHDSFLVRRLREAGFVIVGKTNLPELGILPVTEPRRFGPTRNPWDTGRTPGGSSGGAAAAVAAGMVPVAHGNDGGGSIRIPAACCGLVGLKPTRGRVSRGPETGDSFLVADGVLSRTTRDTAALLDVLAGYEPGDANWAPPPSEPFADAAERAPDRLRVGVTTRPPIEAPLDVQAERAVRDAADLLADAGHQVEEVVPPWGEVDLMPVFTRVFCTNIALGVFFGGAVSGRAPSPELVEPLSLEIWNGVQGYGPLEYPLSEIQLQALTRQVVTTLWSDHDVLLTPALAEAPVPLGEIDASSADPWEDFRRSGRFTPYTAIFNVTGQPAISVPLFQDDDGLPLAVQLAGAPAREDVLLSLAAQLEAARPWADRRPELSVAG